MNTFHGHRFVIKTHDGTKIGDVAIDGKEGQAQLGDISTAGATITSARAEEL
jgi:hypothetical protein